MAPQIVGLLNNDLLAFRAARSEELLAAAADAGASVSGGLSSGDRSVRVVRSRSAPISTEQGILADENLQTTMRRLARADSKARAAWSAGESTVLITPGDSERVAAIQRLLEGRPVSARRFTFVQIACYVASRCAAWKSARSRRSGRTRERARYGGGPEGVRSDT
jgi:trehalose-6-phosphate synthase